MPGEEPVPVIDPASLLEDPEPALFVYRQRFRFPGEEQESARAGIVGLLCRDRAKAIYPHEHTVQSSVEACRRERRRMQLEASMLTLWCDDGDGSLSSLLQVEGQPFAEAIDRFGCVHQLWRMTSADDKLQSRLLERELFLADGHHRFAAGWQLAAIQIRTPAFRTLAAHRLVMDNEEIVLPPTRPVRDLCSFFESAPAGCARVGVFKEGVLAGFELPCALSELNLAVLQERVLGHVRTRPVRRVEDAIAAVKGGAAKMAFLVEPLSVDGIEASARSGTLLPPKSTDFYPKVAGGLIMYRPKELGKEKL